MPTATWEMGLPEEPTRTLRDPWQAERVGSLPEEEGRQAPDLPNYAADAAVPV